MKETSTTLDSIGAIPRLPMHAGAVDSRASAPLVLATTEDIRAGSVLIQRDAALPDSAQFECKRYGSWNLLTESNGFEVGRTLSDARWHFFFMVPEISTGAFSSNSRVGLRKALKKVLAAVGAKSFNAVEIAEIRTRGFLGWNYIQVVAYARHVNNTPFLPEFDPHYLPGTSGTSSRSIEEGPRSAQATRASKRRDGRS
jgi:hypothetical protein